MIGSRSILVDRFALRASRRLRPAVPEWNLMVGKVTDRKGRVLEERKILMIVRRRPRGLLVVGGHLNHRILLTTFGGWTMRCLVVGLFYGRKIIGRRLKRYNPLQLQRRATSTSLFSLQRKSRCGSSSISGPSEERRINGLEETEGWKHGFNLETSSIGRPVVGVNYWRGGSQPTTTRDGGRCLFIHHRGVLPEVAAVSLLVRMTIGGIDGIKRCCLAKRFLI
jgi:hypothetical protein